jgi:hypothetical protein
MQIREPNLESAGLGSSSAVTVVSRNVASGDTSKDVLALSGEASILKAAGEMTWTPYL